MAEFVTVGSAQDVPTGEVRAFQVGSVPVAVANVDGTFYAFDDTCTHRQCSLAEGDLDGTTITCACHGSEFDVTTGEVLNGPAAEPVASYPVQVEGGAIQVQA
ncbi:MAG: non-heme iron oxygenase ferredoxin subunit [Actinomycetota bacterium]|nr:non-heme iron oxygenase ferredoxin subunit [Actinomycetota bacterium]